MRIKWAFVGQQLALTECMNSQLQKSQNRTNPSGWRIFSVLFFAVISCDICSAESTQDYTYLVRSKNGEFEIDQKHLEQTYALHRETGMKTYLPENITARDTQATIANKFLTRATDVFVRQQMASHRKTIQTLQSVNGQSVQSSVRNLEYHVRVLQGRAGFIHHGYFTTTATYSFNRNQMDIELTRNFTSYARWGVSHMTNNEQALSRITVAYEF